MSSSLIVHSQSPYNAEPPLHALRACFITPQSQFYVRSHGNTPSLDEARHRLRVGGLVAAAVEMSVADLKQRFPHRTVGAVMQCAGNRRADMHAVRPVTGNPWAAGAIGNAAWTGVRLADVLRAAGAQQGGGLHVAFDAADDVEEPGEGRFKYGASIPIEKAMSPEVLLAWAMNGETLAAEHGFPLRAVVPGFAGVRSPKWLTAVTVQDRPSENPMQQRDYKLLPPNMTAENVDWGKGTPINDMPVNAAICDPAPGATLAAGRTLLRGYAVATARGIARVDVSPDGGRTWQLAELEPGGSAPWRWTFWRAAMNLPPGESELVVRAWDTAGQAQPARTDDLWNFKGYLSAAWHRVRVRVA